MANSQALTANLNKHWTGNAEELVEEIGRLVGESVPDKEFAPNVRLLRYYQSAGAVSKPERQGKEAIYQYRHLIEVLVARALVLDGWPVQKIANITGPASDEELLAMLPLVPSPELRESRRTNKAQKLVAQFALESSAAEDEVRVSESMAPYSANEWREVTELDLPFGSRLSIDAERLRRLTPTQMRTLTEAVERGLRLMQKKQQSKR